ncbi:hypothetical protein ES319_A05G422100v1 [Gossypium barbadense]|uniref:Uncharacterized protein n=2 Tax=Gossypium TaxID=3633 RepID=A0A5J5W1R7_GOSBA|nr:hypothetical protein ES319_A05G422100v1 [Gossypium barbadense]TYH20687.1 hypothetical protein ES288_A05G450300v1 [Gossypium darwinii]
MTVAPPPWTVVGAVPKGVFPSFKKTCFEGHAFSARKPERKGSSSVDGFNDGEGGLRRRNPRFGGSTKENLAISVQGSSHRAKGTLTEACGVRGDGACWALYFLGA